MPNVELTLLVGSYAQDWAGAEGPMTDIVRRWRDFLPNYLPLPHPSWRNTAWLKKNPWFEADVVPYLQSRVAEMLA
jgi:uracil-DNA glycosylase